MCPEGYHCIDGVCRTSPGLLDGTAPADCTFPSDHPFHFDRPLHDKRPRCSSLSPEGIHLNPGCDPCIIANGVTTVGGLTLNGQPYWEVHCGKRYWKLDLVKGVFSLGSKDVAETYRTSMSPSSASTMRRGVPLNAGHDQCVKDNGVSVVGGVLGNQEPYWQVHCVKKFWKLDYSTKTFLDATSDIAALYRSTSSPGCNPTTKFPITTMNGIYLNPGCDPDVKISGNSAAGGIDAPGGYVWQVHCGKKYWEFSFSPSIFQWVKAGPDIAAHYRTLDPKVCTAMMDGIHLNPGCDPDVKQHGVSAVGGIKVNGVGHWEVHRGKKYWKYSFAKNAFDLAASDVTKVYLKYAP